MSANQRISNLLAQMRELLDELEVISGASSKQSRRREAKAKKVSKRKYRGPSGGVQLLLDEGFFKTPKVMAAVEDRLRQEGYHYRQSAVAMALLRAVRKRLLTRLSSKDAKDVKEKWSYAERK